MKVIVFLYNMEVNDYLKRLSLILFKKEYIALLDRAIACKNTIIDFIGNNFKIFPKRKTPKKLDYLSWY